MSYRPTKSEISMLMSGVDCMIACERDAANSYPDEKNYFKQCEASWRRLKKFLIERKKTAK